MIKVEEEHDQESQWCTHESPLCFNVPKINEPAAIERGEKALCDGQSLDGDSFEAVFGKVTKASPEDAAGSKGKGRDKVSHLEGQKGRLADGSHQVNRHGEQNGNGDAEPSGRIVERKGLKFEEEQLDSLLDVDDADVEAKGRARHVGDEAGKVADVEDGNDKVEAGAANRGRKGAGSVSLEKRSIWRKTTHAQINDQACTRR